MNERIQELAEQAGATVLTTHGMEDVVDGCYVISPAQLEKFAELIVKECIGCCEQVISDPVPKNVDTWLNGGSQCIDEIKEHFEVEESKEDSACPLCGEDGGTICGMTCCEYRS